MVFNFDMTKHRLFPELKNVFAKTDKFYMPSKEALKRSKIRVQHIAIIVSKQS